MLFEEIKINLICIIREEIGEYLLPIDESTTLEDDLGVTGDEAIELIHKISHEFNLNINNFKFNKYFYPEPSFLFQELDKVEELTIGKIIDSIMIGKLI